MIQDTSREKKKFKNSLDFQISFSHIQSLVGSLWCFISEIIEILLNKVLDIHRSSSTIAGLRD